MIKRLIVIPMLALMIGISLSGCFSMGGSYDAPSSTLPPKKEYKSMDELAKAVAAAKADGAAADEVNLKGLDSLFVFKTLPEGAAIDAIKVSAQSVSVGYSFGPTSEDDFSNRMELIWFRTMSATAYLDNIMKSLGTYETIKSDGMDYIHSVPTLQFAVTPEPGSTAQATPTPRAATYCQFLYWVQDDSAFTGAVPLSFTEEEIRKYCVAEKVTLK